MRGAAVAVRNVQQAAPELAPAEAEPPRGTRLWLGSTAVVAGLHAGVLAAVVLWQPAAEPVFPPPGAMMIELAPLAEPPAAPRPPEQAAPEAPKPPPVKKAEVALPKPKPKPKVEPPPAPVPTPAEKIVESDAPPVPAEMPVARTAVAPVPAAAPAPSGDAMPSWQGALRAHLERHKRYPAAAQFRRQQGAPVVRFVMDREGKVLSAQLERGSGYTALDDEALALLQRAQPLPLPPPEVPGERIEMRVPVQFFLR